MKKIKILFPGLIALALHTGAWAQIYETKDAEGNPEFTDSPPQEDATEIDLQQTNIADAPQEQPQEQVVPPQEEAPQQAPIQENSPVIVNDTGGYDDGYNDLEEGELRRQRALEAADPQAPHEVGDSMDQMPDEVGDFDAPEVDEIDQDEPEYIRGAPEQTARPHRR
jgi:hypothetical protein